MAELHDALQLLAPTDIQDFPTEDELELHISGALDSTHTLISSVPPPSVVPPAVALPTPPPTCSTLSKEWKPVKISAKDNPMGISVFKLSAKDGRGAWFARRSIHQDMSFDHFHACLQREFSESQGGEGAVRGIGKEKEVERRESSLGNACVYQLTARFPAIAPREFVQGVVTTTAKPDESEGSRQFTFISRPVKNHPECEERSGFVRGQYESIEYIREIPAPASAQRESIKRAQSDPSVPNLADDAPSSGRRRGNTVTGGGDDKQSSQSAVDWIMITRSDPGGNVPRFMVERGTPNGIIKDAEKFLNWAKGQNLEDEEETTVGMPTPQTTARDEDEELTQPSELDTSSSMGEPSAAGRPTSPQTSGMFASALSTLSGGFSSLASSALGTSSQNPTPPETPPLSSSTPPDDDAETASLASYRSANSEAPTINSVQSTHSTTALSLAPSASSGPEATQTTSADSSKSSSNNTPEDRALSRFLRDKKRLEEKMEKERSKQLTKERKATEKHLREMEKKEKKYRRAVEKVQERKRKDDAKREKAERIAAEKAAAAAEKAAAAAAARKESGGAESLDDEKQPQEEEEMDDEKDVEAKVEARKKIMGIPVTNGTIGKNTEPHVEIEELKRVIEGLTRENLELRSRVEELENQQKEAIELADGKLGAKDVVSGKGCGANGPSGGGISGGGKGVAFAELDE